MTTQLTKIVETERRQTLWQIAILDVARHLIRAGASHLDAASTWAAVAGEAARRAEQWGRLGCGRRRVLR